MGNNVDAKIKQAMNKDGASGVNGGGRRDYDPFASTEEESLFQQAMDMYKGKLKRFAYMITVLMIGEMALIIYSAVQFFKVEDDFQQQLMWATIFLAVCVVICMQKVWGWMQMNKNSLACEIKRLELQIALLKGVISGDD